MIPTQIFKMQTINQYLKYGILKNIYHQGRNFLINQKFTKIPFAMCVRIKLVLKDYRGSQNHSQLNYEIAINEYQALLNTYPNSQKVSHALLKIGYSYAELDNIADAKKILKEVIRQYPDPTVSRLANERLRKIK